MASFDPSSFQSWTLSGSVKTGTSALFDLDVYRAQKDHSSSGAAATIDFSTYVNHVITINADTTLTLINPDQPGECTLRLLGTTGHVITLSPVPKAPGGALAPFVGDCWLRLFWTGPGGVWWAENLASIS